MTMRVFSVGREIPGNCAEYVSFRSDKSLFDADVIFFTPTFDNYSAYEDYMGKKLASQSESCDLCKDSSHWRTEIRNAIESGKVVFIFLTKPVEMYYYTGEKTFSGSGRSTRTTNQVALTNTYDSIPLSFDGLVPRRGDEISPLRGLGELAVYWKEFGPGSSFEVYFDGVKGLTPLLGTKKKEKIIGGTIQGKGGGTVVLLPPVSWGLEDLTYTRGDSTFWKKDATVIGKKFVSTLVGVATALRKNIRKTPAPQWTIDDEYSLATEQKILGQIQDVKKQIIEFIEQQEKLNMELQEAVALKDLLFETGKPLEFAILKALRLMGFTADQYKDGDSEFDVVFTSEEGRLLGPCQLSGCKLGSMGVV